MLTLIQKRWFGRKRTTTLLPDDTLEVIDKKFGSESTYRVPLIQLSPYYVTHKDTKLDCAIGTLVFFMVAVALWYFGYFRSEAPNAGSFVSIAGIFVIFALIAYARWVFEKEDVVVFLDCERKRSMISITRTGTPAEMMAFLEAVVSRIPMPQAKPLAEAPATEIARATNTPGT